MAGSGGDPLVDPTAAALVESITDYAIFRLDRIGNVQTWNAGAQRIKGYDADEILGRHFSEFFDRDDVLAGRPERLLAEAAGSGRATDEGWRIRKDGTRFWAGVVITAIVDVDGNLQGFVKIVRDDSDRRTADAEAQQRELLRDRENLARELNDIVINRIFAAGLSLEAIRRLVDDPQLRERVEAAVQELDAAIEALRGVVFHFRDDSNPGPIRAD